MNKDFVDIQPEIVNIRPPMYEIKTEPYRAVRVHVIGEDSQTVPEDEE